MYQLIIQKALVVDGTGEKAFTADVAVENDRIVAVQPNIQASAKQTINAAGQILTPGFIDTQNHSDSYWQLFSNPTLESVLTQGFTTLLVGNSGASLAPLISEDSLRSVQKWQPTSGLNVNWRSFGEYRTQLANMNFGSNIISLVGYSTIRRGLLGDSTNPPSKSELQSLLGLLEQSFGEGAAGVSIGLQYSHEINVTDVELVALAELAARHDKLLAVSLRNESEQVVESARELAALAEQTGARIKISHLKIRHRAYWPLLTQLLDTLETAWHRGAKIYFDCYPYTETWQPLYTYLPTWATEGGRQQLLGRLQNDSERKRILSALQNHPTNLSEITIASSGPGMKVNGRKMSELAKTMGLTSEETILNLIEHGGSATLVFDNCLDQGTVNLLCNHALSFLGTNGGGFSLQHSDRLVHPRCFGSSAKFLRQVLDTKAISLEEAIAKMTSRPAKALNLNKKGVIATGYDADLVIFDPTKINSQASITNPYQYSQGMTAVLVGGQMAVQNSQPTGLLSGKFIAS